MQPLQPLVSIVIIAFNEEKYLSYAIESAISQTYQNKEIIVVDDGSTDQTVNIARRYDGFIKLISQKNSGGCSSPRNTGMKEAKGKYITFLDGDDVLLPSKLSVQVTVLEENPEIELVVNDYCNFLEDKIYPSHFSTCPKLSAQFREKKLDSLIFAPGDASKVLIEENFSIAGSPMFKTTAIREIGGFNTKLYSCEDFHLNYRMALKFSVIVHNQILFHRRLHGANMSSNQIKMGYYYALSRFDLIHIETSADRRDILKKRIRVYLNGLLKSSLRKRNFSAFYKGLKLYTALFFSG